VLSKEMNEQHAKRYAQLLVKHGVDLRPGQPLYVFGQVAHRHLIALLTEVAYEAGSGPVETRLFDSLQQAALIRHGRLEDIALCHTETQAWFSEIVRHGGAYICLQGPEIPQLWNELARTHPERHALYQRGFGSAGTPFRRYGLDTQLCPWAAAPWPTVGWAREVFADLAEAEAFDRLAELIFRFTYADQENALDLNEERDRWLKTRCRHLDELAITEIRVTGGGTDLRVALSPQARWQGGSEQTVAGQRFCSNVPTEEVFTTPDRRRTEGRLAASRPFRLPGGPLVRDLVLHFEQGRVVVVEASSEQAAFESWLDVHEGARHLGEIALVGDDSLVARSGLFFDFVQLDENAAAHVGLGQGFARALAERARATQLEELGCNRSDVHVDVVFGSPQVRVVATASREGEVALLDGGLWCGPLPG
jgi:aminopeptidase